MLVSLFVEENDSNAFAQLYGLTYNKIYNYACYYLKDTYLAQDALQEIYIQVMKKLPDLKEPELFISWLNTIAFHVCYDIAIRKSKVEFSSSELFELLNFADSQNTPDRKSSVPKMPYVHCSNRLSTVCPSWNSRSLYFAISTT